MVMKTVARGRSEGIDPDLVLIKKRKEKKKRKTRNKLYTRLKALACVFCAGYNREGSKKAADILLQYVQGDANRK